MNEWSSWFVPECREKGHSAEGVGSAVLAEAWVMARLSEMAKVSLEEQPSSRIASRISARCPE